MAIDGNTTRVKDELRQSFEGARAAFYRVLDSIDDSQWNMPSANPKWSIGATFAHICGGLGTVPLRMTSAREGKPKQWMPRFVFDFVNTMLSRKLGRQYDRTSIRRYFEEQYAAAVAQLEDVKDSEWDLVSRTYIQRWTVRELFAYQPAHIAQHLKDIKAAV
jgi:DinB superfamily